jgi:hypothetical protein
MKMLRLIRMGLGDLPGYGPHPGTPLMVLFSLMPFIAAPDWVRVWISELVMWATIGAVYLAGAHARADDYLWRKNHE